MVYQKIVEIYQISRQNLLTEIYFTQFYVLIIFNFYVHFFQIQFCITLTHTTISLRQEKCDFPVWGQYLLASLMVSMLILFSNFYLHAYIFRKSKKADKNGALDNGTSNGNVKNRKKNKKDN